MEPFSWEAIGPLRVCITKEHRFGTDAFLLADFARPRRGDKVCDLCAGQATWCRAVSRWGDWAGMPRPGGL